MSRCVRVLDDCCVPNDPLVPDDPLICDNYQGRACHAVSGKVLDDRWVHDDSLICDDC